MIIEDEQTEGKHMDHNHTMIISSGPFLSRDSNHTRKQYAQYSLTPNFMIISPTKIMKYSSVPIKKTQKASHILMMTLWW